MDKYTVDLDQVLNDFEYSELTDQHSKNVSERPQNLPFQPVPVTKHSINNVFHSLNEYLNSGINGGSGASSLIQSYLPENKLHVDNKLDYSTATDVSSKVEEHQNNILDSSRNSFKEVCQHEEVSTPKKDEENNDSNPENKDVLVSDPQTVISESVQYIEEKSGNIANETTSRPEQIIETNDNCEKHGLYLIKTESPDFSLLETDNFDSKQLSELNHTENVIEKERTLVNNDFECDRNIIDKADSELGKDAINIESIETYFQVNKEPVAEEVDVNNVQPIEQVDDVNKKEEDVLVNIEEDNVQNVDSQDKLVDFVIEPSDSPYALQELSQIGVEQNVMNEKVLDATSEDVHLVENEFEQTNEEVLPDIKTNIEQNPEALCPEDPGLKESSNSIDNIIREENIEDYADTPSQKIIGFSADIDIDESELNKMLEDLELEVVDSDIQGIEKTTEYLDKYVDENSEEVGNITIETINGSTKHEEEHNDGEAAVCQINELNSELQVSSSDTSPAIDPEAKLEKSSYNAIVEDDGLRTKENIHPQVIECLELEKPSKSKKSKSTGQSELNTKGSVGDVEENFEKPSGTVTVEEKKLSIKNEDLQESSIRPHNLPLNNELKDDNVGRKINLIGSPGSTPYNNVYINKSMEPKTTQENESDCTSSASPTFSDCSTESTSTASTVSVDDVPNNADKFSKKKSGVKNTNVESEFRASEQAREVQQSVGEKHTSQESSNNQSANQNVEGIAGIQDAAGDILNNSESAAGISQAPSSQSGDTFLDKSWLGKEAPLWIPDGDAAACLHCDMKFTVLKRRHHCRACGLVLCSKCCNLKLKLEYLEAEARVCNKCYSILNKDTPNNAGSNYNSPESGNSPAFRPNPNNPLEYCSTVSPLQQAGQTGAIPPSVMVPVGVLKRKGSNKKSNKSVMFCDGIAPGSDLTNLDQDFNYSSDSKTPKPPPLPPQVVSEAVKKKEDPTSPPAAVPAAKISRNQPKIDDETGCFIPKSETSLPPTISINKTDILYSDCSNSPSVVEMLKNEALIFAINQNLFVHVKIINMNCCINKPAWCFCTEGLIDVGSDEVVYLVEYIEEESFVPKDAFFHVQNVYLDAVKGTSVKELGLSLHNTSNFLDSRNHAGFVYIKPTFQCLENVIIPKEPYLIGILIHRWETPWAKLFPLRLILRLGAEYRYYPSPLISTRHRDSVFVEIGHTIINLLADFRNFTYTLPQIRGLTIHMEDKKTTISIPRNRYEQVMKSINNSSEHILAFAGNFSSVADSHLVCIQDTQGHENCYTTHAINIHNKPRKITGASFIVFNGSLKSSSGLTAKSNIVEDGLMIQVPSEHMDKIRDSLRNMKNHTIACGFINATSDETVNLVWGENDVDFNVGVKSPVDLADMKGVPSIRVHNGKDYFCNNGSRLIRWTEVFILENGEENSKNQDPVDVSKVSESIAKACCTALVKYLDLLVSNSCQKIGIRATLHVENVSYSAGSNGLKLPPIYMRSLDNELVPVLHRITSNNLGDNVIVLELIFRILNA